MLGGTSHVAVRKLGAAAVGKERLLAIARVDSGALAAITTEALQALARVDARSDILAGGIVSAVARFVQSAVVNHIAHLAITGVTHIARASVLCEASLGACGIATAVAVVHVTVLNFLAVDSVTGVVTVALAVPLAGASVKARGVGVAARRFGLQAHVDCGALVTVTSETLLALASARARTRDGAQSVLVALTVVELAVVNLFAHSAVAGEPVLAHALLACLGLLAVGVLVAVHLASRDLPAGESGSLEPVIA